MEDIDHLTGAIKELEQLNKLRLYVGAFIPGNGESIETLQMILGVQETGATITPHTAKYLTIPTKYAGRHKARDFNDLFFYITKSSGQPSLARIDNGQVHVYFLLAQKVVIPARPVLMTTATLCIGDATKLVKEGIEDILVGKQTARNLLDEIGGFFTLVLKQQILHWQTPPNAQITADRKGFNNPLIDTGTLLNSINWVVI